MTTINLDDDIVRGLELLEPEFSRHGMTREQAAAALLRRAIINLLFARNTTIGFIRVGLWEALRGTYGRPNEELLAEAAAKYAEARSR